jgi:phytoene dehydrogenase-like protein
MSTNKTYDNIFIGSGINSLVGAALLAKSGKKVLLLERSDYIGGCIKSKEVENCIIDLFSTAYPLLLTSKAYSLLSKDLEKEGIEFISNDKPTATILNNGESFILYKDREKNIKNLNQLVPGDGDTYNIYMEFIEKNADFLFTLLSSELRTKSMLLFMVKHLFKNGIKNSIRDIGEYLPTISSQIETQIKSPLLKAILAPWVLHTGLSVNSPFSALMSKIICFTLEFVGTPFIKGGSYKIVEALQRIIEKNGGNFSINKDVVEIITKNNQAVGVKTQDGSIYKGKNIIANVTPNALYGKLLKNQKEKNPITYKQAKEFKFNSKGNMQIHLILKEKISWKNSQLNEVGYIHITDGIDSVSKAINEASRGDLPVNPTICIAQPSDSDPSRVKNGKSILWIQLPETPYYPVLDSANELNELIGIGWSEELKEAYSNRIIDLIANHLPRLKENIIYKEIISPKDLYDTNINLVNGDPYSGECELEQYLLFRPLKSTKNHETSYENLFHIGSSTHPGPGLGAGSGVHIFEKLK